MADEHVEIAFRSPRTLGGTAVSLMLYVEDVDTVFARTVDAGAKVHQPLKDQFYGDRSGTVIDPYGHVWTIASHIEDVSMDEMQRRMAAMNSTI
jgi:PhnB protein